MASISGKMLSNREFVSSRRQSQMYRSFGLCARFAAHAPQNPFGIEVM